MEVTIRNVIKRFGKAVAVDNVSLTIGSGEFITLLGPSGCGKTTLLRSVAGFVQPDEGQIQVGGQDITHLPAFKRGVGMVFQNYALFPHMTVAQNIAFSLRMKSAAKTEQQRKAEEMLEMVSLSGFGNRYPHQLSGGQQQRVAIARVLALEPKVLLLDEPFGALDKKLRVQMQIELKKLIQPLNITTMFVTHDQEEALVMSDRIAVMDFGRIIQADSPVAIYDHPTSQFVAAFVGDSNLLPVVVKDVAPGGATVQVCPGMQILLPAAQAPAAGCRATLLVRPENVAVSQAPGPGTVEATVGFVVQMGAVTAYELQLPGAGLIKAMCPRLGGQEGFQVGDTVHVHLVEPASCTLFGAA